MLDNKTFIFIIILVFSALLFFCGAMSLLIAKDVFSWISSIATLLLSTILPIVFVKIKGWPLK